MLVVGEAELMPKVPTYNLPAMVVLERRGRKVKQKRIPPTQEELEVRARLKSLEAERKALVRTLALMVSRRKALNGKPVRVWLYALRLEDNCWYVGMTYNVQRRFEKHFSGKGAAWTKRHKPIEIVEQRQTDCILQLDAAKLEDDMTLEYALKYGGDNVRGGGYCQVKYVRWPDVVLQNEV
jgi:predicted GIY-YIG superfamily endonuclease